MVTLTPGREKRGRLNCPSGDKGNFKGGWFLCFPCKVSSSSPECVMCLDQTIRATISVTRNKNGKIIESAEFFSGFPSR